MPDHKAMKTYITTTDAEARGLHDGRVTLLVVPFKEHPPEDWSPVDCGLYNPVRYDKSGESYPGPEIFGAYDEDWGIEAPFAPGDRIAVKERWAKCDCGAKGCPGYIYPEHLGWNCRTSNMQKSAEVMPMKAVRTHVLCESVAGRPVGSITEDEARRFWWQPCPKMASFSGLAYDQLCGDRASEARWLGPVVDEWHRRHPGLPFETAWAWFVQVIKQ